MRLLYDVVIHNLLDQTYNVILVHRIYEEKLLRPEESRSKPFGLWFSLSSVVS